ncbi:MAG: radical SAM protein, partial [Clostridia bacterium]|nr:radical SAM protein [Clostridia bacterium]
LAQVLEDEDFYRASGGGVTFSGGEPLLQADGVAEIAKALGAQGISVVVDTAGCVPWESFAAVLDVTDLFYFDYKTPYPDAYREVVGGDYALIYGNLCKLIASGAHVHVRVPLIPGVNTDAQACAKACEQLLAAGVQYVDLLPFHRMGTGKYEALGKAYAYAGVQPLSFEEISQIASIYRQYFEISIE